MAKKQVEDEAPSVAADVKAPEYSPAQLYKQAQIKALADKRSKKLSEVLTKVKELESGYKTGIRGSLIPYTEKNGVESPAQVIAERFKDDTGEVILTLLVYSPSTAQPYRAELTF